VKPDLIAAALFGVVLLFTIARAGWRAWRKHMSLSQKEVDVMNQATAEVTRLTKVVADLTAARADDDAKTTAMAAQLAALQAAGDPDAMDAAVAGLVTQLQGIGVTPPPAPVAVDPSAPVSPVAPTDPVPPAAAPPATAS
jgi:hypothetical protein